MTQVNVDIQPVTVLVEEEPTTTITIIAQGPQGPLSADLTALEARVAALEAQNVFLLEDSP